VFKWESLRVGGAGSNLRDINDVLWTREEMIRELGLSGSEVMLFDQFISSMRNQSQIMEIRDWKEGASGYLTRTAETVRLLGHTYEYWWRGRPGIQATRWEVVPKLIPRRGLTSTELLEGLLRELEENLEEVPPGLERACEDCVEGAVKFLGFGESTRFSKFQLEGIARGVINGLNGESWQGLALVAGVGAGKTLTFMLPAMILARYDMEDDSRGRGAHLLLYPRTALAKNQMTEALRPLAIHCGIPARDVHSEMSSDYPGSVRQGILATHGRGKKNPRLILCTMETLKNRMAHPLFVKFALSRVDSVSIDEVHLFNGVSGAQNAMLLRRLRQLCKMGKTTWVGASATIAFPKEHLSRLVGLNDDRKLSLVMPDNNDLVHDGVVHHTFIRPRQMASVRGTLVNASSLLVHNRRDDLSVRPRDKKGRVKTAKTIGFADNLEILGGWNDDFRENERPDEIHSGTQRRTHPRDEDPNEWGPIQREIPYASRFQYPLQRRIACSGGVGDDGEYVLSEVLTDFRPGGPKNQGEKGVCDRCKEGEHIDLGLVDEEGMQELKKLVHRWPHKEEDPFHAFLVDHEVFDGPHHVGTLHRCPYLISGSCTWFPESPVEKSARIGNKDGTERYEHASVATSKVKSSQTDDGDGEDLVDLVFSDTNENLYSVDGATGDNLVDLVLASPSLEVGIDLENLTESIMRSAVRNVASYRQKAGRVGRESLSEALNVTLATESSNDIHYYRQPRKLIDLGRLEPVPLKERNEAVAYSTAYLAVWDWLVKKKTVPEDIASYGPGDISEKIRECQKSLLNQRDSILEWIHWTLDRRYDKNTDFLGDAIEQVLKELGQLLREIGESYTFEPPLALENPVVIDALSHMLNANARAKPHSDVSRLKQQIDRSLDNLKNSRNRCGFLERDHPEIMKQIFDIVGGAERVPNQVEELAERIGGLQFEQRSERRRVTTLVRDLDELTSDLEELVEKGYDLDAISIVDEYQRWDTDESMAPKRWYLSMTMRRLEVIRNCRLHDWFVSPEALYKHPHEKKTTITGSYWDSDTRKMVAFEREVDRKEALHRFLPGTWTKAFPQYGTLKTICDRTSRVGSGSVYRANLGSQNLRDSGLLTEVLGTFPAPPGFPEGSSIKIVTPLSIPTNRAPRRYIPKDQISAAILDGDEGDPRGMDPTQVRIPKTYASRWVNAELGDSEPVSPYLEMDDDEALILTDQVGMEVREVERSEVKHPLVTSAFSDVSWHPELKITEYSYNISRPISTQQGYGSELIYTDSDGSDLAFGIEYDTEGVCFKLDGTAVKRVTERVTGALNEGSGPWSPTMIRMLKSFIVSNSQEWGERIGGYASEDVVGVLLDGWVDNGCRPIGIPWIVERCEELVGNRDLIEEASVRRISAKFQINDEEVFGGQAHQEDADSILEEAGRLSQTVFRVADALLGTPQAIQDWGSLWIHRTILMSFGVISVEALQRLSGGDEKEVGYAIPRESWLGGDTRIVIFDKAERGNGNASVARKFMHIPNLARSADIRRSAMLPTEDMLSLLESSMMPCQQHHTDMLGLEYKKTGGVDSRLHRSMSDLSNQGKHVFQLSEDVWSSLGIDSMEDGWKLPLIEMIRKEIANGDDDLHLDDLTRASKICWNGCPECIDKIRVAQGGFAGLDFLDKAVLDEWFKDTRENSDEFHRIDLNHLASGDYRLTLGGFHSIALRKPDQRVRSTLLPWTIGVDIDRFAPNENASIIIRESDVSGMRLFDDEDASGTQQAVPGLSVKRLIWYDLLMTAYLDLCGLIQDDKKSIKLVYFDARDVSFDDVGIAPRMLDSLRTAAEKDGVFRMESLKDVLSWLGRRGFDVVLCVDSGQMRREEGVVDFVKALLDDGNVDVKEGRAREWGNMHAKILITPLYALSGSSNMSEMGLRISDEINGHHISGDMGYDRFVVACNDIVIPARGLTSEQVASIKSAMTE